MRRTFLVGALLIVGTSTVPDATASERHVARVPLVAEGEQSVRTALEALASAHGLTLTIHGDAAWTVTTAVNTAGLDETLRQLGVVNYAWTGDRLIVFLKSSARDGNTAARSIPAARTTRSSVPDVVYVTSTTDERSRAEARRLARVIDDEARLAGSVVDHAALEEIATSLQVLLP